MRVIYVTRDFLASWILVANEQDWLKRCATQRIWFCWRWSPLTKNRKCANEKRFGYILSFSHFCLLPPSELKLAETDPSTLSQNLPEFWKEEHSECHTCLRDVQRSVRQKRQNNICHADEVHLLLLVFLWESAGFNSRFPGLKLFAFENLPSSTIAQFNQLSCQLFILQKLWFRFSHDKTRMCRQTGRNQAVKS